MNITLKPYDPNWKVQFESLSNYLNEYLKDKDAVIRQNICKSLGDFGRDFTSEKKLIEALSHNLVIFKKMLVYHRVLESLKRKHLLKTVQQIIIHLDNGKKVKKDGINRTILSQCKPFNNL